MKNVIKLVQRLEYTELIKNYIFPFFSANLKYYLIGTNFRGENCDLDGIREIRENNLIK